MSPHELAYYRSCVVIERELAAKSTNQAVADIRESLAQLYEKLIVIEQERPALSIVAKSP